MKKQAAQQGDSGFIDYHGARIAGLNLIWREVLHLGTKKTYPQSGSIPHGTIQGFFYLDSGVVELAYNNIAGTKRTALCYGPGMLINEARTLSGHNPGGTFTCLEAAELYLFDKNLLTTEFIARYPHLILNMLRGMSVKMLLHYSFVTTMGTGSHLSQVCRFILSQSALYGNADRFSPGFTQQQVADLLGMHRTTLARTVQRLKAMGGISAFVASNLRIENRAVLEELAGDVETIPADF